MNRSQFLSSLLAAAAGTAAFPALARVAPGEAPEAWPPQEAPEADFWKFLRGQFPLTHDRAYLNTGGLGASPYAVIDAVKSKMDELEAISEPGHDDKLWDAIKADAGRLLGCDPGELAFTRNTTEGINIVAHGLPFKPGDEVITSTQEHVANIFTWLVLQKRAGIVLRFFEPSARSDAENLERIAALLSPRTRLISVAHALTTTGTILPIRQLAQLARDRHVWLFVDGAQTAGMMPVDLHDLGCDAYATSGHKWLMGPKETGLLYVRKDMLDTIQTKYVGAYSDNGFDQATGTFAFHPTARRYEYGTVSVPLRVGLHEAVKFVQRIGIERIWRRDRALATRLTDGLLGIPGVELLSPRDPSMRSGMVTFKHAKIPYTEILRRLDALKLRTRPVTEGGLAALRVSTHVYNMEEEVDRVLEGVRSL